VEYCDFTVKLSLIEACVKLIVVAFNGCESKFVVPTHGGKSKMLVKKNLLLILIDVQIRCVMFGLLSCCIRIR
jgi:hypothetical protein